MLRHCLTEDLVQLELAEPLLVLLKRAPLYPAGTPISGTKSRATASPCHAPSPLLVEQGKLYELYQGSRRGLHDQASVLGSVHFHVAPCCTNECCCAGPRARAWRVVVLGPPSTRRGHRRRLAARVLCSRLHSLRWAVYTELLMGPLPISGLLHMQQQDLFSSTLKS